MQEIPEIIRSVAPISQNFTIEKSIEEQRAAHEKAKQFLTTHLTSIGASVSFISPPESANPMPVATIMEIQELSRNVFSWQNTHGVAQDMQQDGLRSSDDIIVYGAASQFNGCEACGPYTLQPGNAVRSYRSDHTQGPQAQLQFHPYQVELINCAGNIGFNGLCNLLDEETKSSVTHGYFMPNETQADAIIQALSTKDDIEYLSISNPPYKEGRNGDEIKPVHMILISAPAFGYGGIRFGNKRDEIEFLCALKGFRAQFQYCIDLAIRDGKPVVFKAAGMGLGVFGNNVINVAKAFNVAGKEFESKLKENRVQVRFQVFRGTGKARELAHILDLHEWKS